MGAGWGREGGCQCPQGNRAPRERNKDITLGGAGGGRTRLPPLDLASNQWVHLGVCGVWKPSPLSTRITPSLWRSPPQGRYRGPGPTSHTHAAAPPTLLRRGAGAGPLLAARAGTLSLGRGAHGRGLLIALVLTSGLVTKGDQMRVYREQASPGV